MVVAAVAKLICRYRRLLNRLPTGKQNWKGFALSRVDLYHYPLCPMEKGFPQFCTGMKPVSMEIPNLWLVTPLAKSIRIPTSDYLPQLISVNYMLNIFFRYINVYLLLGFLCYLPFLFSFDFRLVFSRFRKLENFPHLALYYGWMFRGKIEQRKFGWLDKLRGRDIALVCSVIHEDIMGVIKCWVIGFLSSLEKLELVLYYYYYYF